jgi:hypothetical protein
MHKLRVRMLVVGTRLGNTRVVLCSLAEEGRSRRRLLEGPGGKRVHLLLKLQDIAIMLQNHLLLSGCSVDSTR